MANSNFLILGRPRSRTAWVANLLTVPPVSHCLHEGLADVGASLAQLRGRLSRLSAGAAGDADTGLVHHLDEVQRAFPDARLVLMTGSDTSWKRWCAKLELPAAVRTRVEADYSRALELLRGRALFVDCRAVTTEVGEARRLWEYCVPGHPFETQRWEMLRDLNVQVIPESLAARLKRSGFSTDNSRLRIVP